MSKLLPFVLLIDDDEDDLELLSSSLELAGVNTKSFDSGNKAVFYLSFIADVTEFPSLIISDFNMPGMNGEEVLSFVKSNKATQSIPVVILSTGMSPSLKNTLSEHGALGCFAKPLSYSEEKRQVELFKNLACSQMPEKQFVNQMTRSHSIV